MLPTMVRAESVIMSPEVNATFTTPWGRSSTMNTRLRIVRPGSDTTIVAGPVERGGGDDAWRGHGCHPQLGVKVP
jgi:hypothetical protein